MRLKKIIDASKGKKGDVCLATGIFLNFEKRNVADIKF